MEKMKKILCLVLSFVLLISNAQVFAQEVGVRKPINNPYELFNEFDNVNQMLRDLRGSYRFVSRPGTLDVYGKRILYDNIVWNQERVTNLNKAYTELLDKTYSYKDYILEEKGKTALERATYKYIGAPEVTTRHYQLEEGAIFERLQKIVDDLKAGWETKETVESFIETAKGQEQVVDDLISALNSRLAEVKSNIFRDIIEPNEAVVADNMAEIISKHIKKEDVLKAAMKRVPPEELRAIGLIRARELGYIGDLQVTLAMNRYLKKMGFKNKPSIFKIFKNVACDHWGMKQWDPLLKDHYKYRNLVEEFPIFKNGKFINPRYTIRKVLRSTPLVIVGVVLTAAAITEISSDNSFAQGTLGARKMKELKNKIESGEASFTEAMVYYSDERSTSEINKNSEHLINAINLSLAVVQADKDFDRIAQSIQDEVGNEYAAASAAEVQNSFDMYYDSALQQVMENMI